MASSASSSASSSSTSATVVSNSIVNPSLLLLSNMVSMMTEKLDHSNYLVWRHQKVVILEAYSMIKFVDDSGEVADQFVKDSSRRFITEVNPDFVNWKNREQALFTFINSTLSPSILAITWVKGLQKEFGKF